MKKKKLKKKLRQLEKEIKDIRRRGINLSSWTMAKVDELKKRACDSEKQLSQMQRDNRLNILWEWMQRSGIDFHDWGKTPTYAEEVVYTEDIQRQINELKSEMHSYDSRLSILDARSRVDYTMYGTNKVEKTCDTCKWYPLSKQGGQDIPCMGCTTDDKKMWKSKEA